MNNYNSPINGSELSPTEQNGIMYSESDGLLYKVTEQGNIIPLKNPINGGSLISLSSNLFQDPNTLQYFKVENNSLLPAPQIDLEDKVEEFVRYR